MSDSVNGIALIDDDRSTNFYNKWLIQKQSAADEVWTYADGEEAIDGFKSLLEEGKPLPEVILLDINMPVMDGFQFLEVFSTLELPGERPAIFLMLTNPLLEEQQTQAAKHDIECMRKPLDEEKINQILEKFHFQRQSQDATG